MYATKNQAIGNAVPYYLVWNEEKNPAMPSSVLPVPSTVDNDTSTSLAMIPCGGFVVIVIHTGDVELLSAMVTVSGTEKSATTGKVLL